MALPRAPEARWFYQAAQQRLTDANLLRTANRTTGAVYLAGYAIECMLKAMILSVLPGSVRDDMVASFKGSRAHDFGWLRKRYETNGRSPVPASILRCLALTGVWTTDLRYMAGTIGKEEAGKFFEATELVLAWADGRI